MKFHVPPKKNDGKMLAVVKLIIVNCTFSLPQEKSRRLCRNKMAEFHSQTLVCVINLT